MQKTYSLLWGLLIVSSPHCDAVSQKIAVGHFIKFNRIAANYIGNFDVLSLNFQILPEIMNQLPQEDFNCIRNQIIAYIRSKEEMKRSYILQCFRIWERKMRPLFKGSPKIYQNNLSLPFNTALEEPIISELNLQSSHKKSVYDISKNKIQKPDLESIQSSSLKLFNTFESHAGLVLDQIRYSIILTLFPDEPAKNHPSFFIPFYEVHNQLSEKKLFRSVREKIESAFEEFEDKFPDDVITPYKNMILEIFTETRKSESIPFYIELLEKGCKQSHGFLIDAEKKKCTEPFTEEVFMNLIKQQKFCFQDKTLLWAFSAFHWKRGYHFNNQTSYSLRLRKVTLPEKMILSRCQERDMSQMNRELTKLKI